jgi:hypothetical protein
MYEVFQFKTKLKKKNSMDWNELYSDSNFKNLCCSEHLNCVASEANIAVIFKESPVKGIFDKYVINELNSEIGDYIETNFLQFDYLPLMKNNLTLNEKREKRKKKTEQFQNNCERLQKQSTNQMSVIDKVIQLITRPEWKNTTFISQDLDSLNFVSQLILKTLYFGK